MNIVGKIYKVTKTSGPTDNSKHFCFTVETMTPLSGKITNVLCIILNPQNNIIDYFLTENLDYCKKYYTFVKDKFLDYDETISLLEKFNEYIRQINPTLKIENIK